MSRSVSLVLRYVDVTCSWYISTGLPGRIALSSWVLSVKPLLMSHASSSPNTRATAITHLNGGIVLSRLAKTGGAVQQKQSRRPLARPPESHSTPPLTIPPVFATQHRATG